MKIYFWFSLASAVALGFTSIAPSQLNQSIAKMKIGLFAFADNDTKKDENKKKL